MEVDFETILKIDGNEAFRNEIKVSDTRKSIIKEAILAAIKKCGHECTTEIVRKIDEYVAP